MPSWSFFSSSSPTDDEDERLTPAQRRMYAMEKGFNFRTLSKLCATQSARTLGPDDLVSAAVFAELAGVGQFAEAAYPLVPPEYIFDNLDTLMKKDFPLEGYDALPGTKLISGFRSTVAKSAGYVAYRTNTQQLVVSFSGSMTLTQFVYNVKVTKMKHPAGKGCYVHAGAWDVYNGMQATVKELVAKGLKENDVREVMITGHSQGASLASLFAFDALDTQSSICHGLPLLIVAFGSPRVANQTLAEHFRARVAAYEGTHGVGTVREYLIKAYNDGATSFPPIWMGFRHITTSQLYLYRGGLLRIPPSESECGLFPVSRDALDVARPVEHPRGGHGYYSGRDIEKVVRRVTYFKKMMESGGTDWEKEYLSYISKLEREEAAQQ
ncbi:hypothetical protein CERSUDRAFT_110576 [Gelatoporia subvermispora B]|uniref:Fungal lipase-type domain-containing protein n=1 Tax=Ceriporiopsis subvermispora (strain B) TaxID=914234 RepID=M2RC52_CERS8|nr:hypothetical protein CERSUDRAFT_110576 [Gelatoporia subvermispora B]